MKFIHMKSFIYGHIHPCRWIKIILSFKLQVQNSKLKLYTHTQAILGLHLWNQDVSSKSNLKVYWNLSLANLTTLANHAEMNLIHCCFSSCQCMVLLAIVNELPTFLGCFSNLSFFWVFSYYFCYLFFHFFLSQLVQVFFWNHYMTLKVIN
jgi:hypothetical protein